MKGFGQSDIGKHRESNQDAILISNEQVGCLPNLYIVADGMGGHRAGNIASALSIASFEQYILNPELSNGELLENMVCALNYANHSVYTESRQHEEYFNMGTTFIGCTIENNNAYIAHVGDSRVYRISCGRITQITNDHSFIAEMLRAGKITPEEAAVHPKRNSITRAVGTDRTVEVDGIICPLYPGDYILMCSDGLYGMMSDEDILALATEEGKTLEERTKALVDLANANGGTDNISVILINI
jgi:protein phosphatase